MRAPQASSSGLSSSLSLSSYLASLSTSDLYLNDSFNASSTLNSTSLPVYGPEWEWSPRDLIVYAPQPSCPVPVLRSDMSTLPTLHRCTSQSQDYYADLLRVARLKRAVTVHRKLARREVMRQETVRIESIRERELVHRMRVDRYQRAWLLIALCFTALVVGYGLFICSCSPPLLFVHG